MCPRTGRYERPMAPPMAAERARPSRVHRRRARGELRWPDGVDVGFVEGAGGLRSPIAADGDTVDLAAALAPDLVVLVADAGLGTINAVRLSVEPFAGRAVVVALNRFDDGRRAARGQPRWLVDRDGLDVVTSPTALGGPAHPILIFGLPCLESE